MTVSTFPGKGLRCILDVKASLGECPVWSAAVDVPGPQEPAFAG